MLQQNSLIAYVISIKLIVFYVFCFCELNKWELRPAFLFLCHGFVSPILLRFSIPTLNNLFLFKQAFLFLFHGFRFSHFIKVFYFNAKQPFFFI